MLLLKTVYKHLSLIRLLPLLFLHATITISFQCWHTLSSIVLRILKNLLVLHNKILIGVFLLFQRTFLSQI